MNLNPKVLADIADKTPTAEAFFEYISSRTRNVRDGVSPLSALKAQMSKETGFIPVPKDLLVMFKELERAGVGTLKDGAFKWNVSIKQISQVINGMVKKTKSVAAHSAAVSPGNGKHVCVYFGPGKEIDIQLPSNLTKDEAQFIASKILSLY